MDQGLFKYITQNGIVTHHPGKKIQEANILAAKAIMLGIKIKFKHGKLEVGSKNKKYAYYSFIP